MISRNAACHQPDCKTLQQTAFIDASKPAGMGVEMEVRKGLRKG